LAKLVHPSKGLIRARTPARKSLPAFSMENVREFEQLVCLLVRTLGKMTYFRLTKLLYLIDLSAIEVLGHAITGEIYLRQPDGPWPPALQKRLPMLDGMEITLSSRGRIPMISPGPSPRFEPVLDDAALEVVADVVDKYGNLNNNEIKTVAYKTRPMRYVLTQEKQGRNMRNFVIIYKNKATPDTDE
jgi:hypothetical protein